ANNGLLGDEESVVKEEEEEEEEERERDYRWLQGVETLNSLAIEFQGKIHAQNGCMSMGTDGRMIERRHGDSGCISGIIENKAKIRKLSFSFLPYFLPFSLLLFLQVEYLTTRRPVEQTGCTTEAGSLPNLGLCSSRNLLATSLYNSLKTIKNTG
ncbi:hypothetical protein FRC15_007315, partial [Serendipita sp. 397]